MEVANESVRVSKEVAEYLDSVQKSDDWGTYTAYKNTLWRMREDLGEFNRAVSCLIDRMGI